MTNESTALVKETQLKRSFKLQFLSQFPHVVPIFDAEFDVRETFPIFSFRKLKKGSLLHFRVPKDEISELMLSGL